jgi:alpha-L-arabinofuranosidase
MFEAGGRRIAVDVSGNPRRNPGLGVGEYAALAVASTRAHGSVYLMVVNRLPLQGQDVHAAVRLRGFTTNRTMFVRAVTSPSFMSTTKPNATSRVSLHTRQRQIGTTGGFAYTFPAHSVTLLRIPAG